MNPLDHGLIVTCNDIGYKRPNWVGGRVAPPVLPPHRTYGTVHGGSHGPLPRAKVSEQAPQPPLGQAPVGHGGVHGEAPAFHQAPRPVVVAWRARSASTPRATSGRERGWGGRHGSQRLFRSRWRRPCSRPSKAYGPGARRQEPSPPPVNGVIARLPWRLWRPRPWCGLGRRRAVARWRDGRAGFRRGAPWWVAVYPRHVRFQSRATALWPRFPFNRRCPSRQGVRDALTRSPARWLRTDTVASAAERPPRGPRRARSGAKLSPRLLDQRGERGAPGGAPHRVASSGPLSSSRRADPVGSVSGAVGS